MEWSANLHACTLTGHPLHQASGLSPPTATLTSTTAPSHTRGPCCAHQPGPSEMPTLAPWKQHRGACPAHSDGMSRHYCSMPNPAAAASANTHTHPRESAPLSAEASLHRVILYSVLHGSV